jgi:hypothetical protein
MKNFKSIHVQWAKSKELSSRNMVEYAILRAMVTVQDPTDENLVNQAAYYINRAFTPITKKIKLDNGREPRDTLALIVSRMKGTLPYYGENVFETQEGLDTYQRIIAALHERYKRPQDYYQRKYVYIFVRQDISPEYQAVQAAHAACKMGHRSAAIPEKDFDNLYFALIGVPNLEAMAIAIKDCNEVGATVYPFYEPDIGNQLTAFATDPIWMSQRKRLLSYNRLRFRGKNS